MTTDEPPGVNDRPATDHSRTDRAARLVASNHSLWERTKAHGLPRWAARTVAAAFVIGVVSAALAYLVSHSLLAVVVIIGPCWFVGLVVLTFADMAERQK